MRYDGAGMSLQEAQQERLRRIAESRKTEVNEKEKAEDAKNVAKMQDREEKKMEEKEVEFQEGGVLQTKEEIRQEAFDDMRRALKVLQEFPELVRLVGEQR